jgi:hypothetical protein
MKIPQDVIDFVVATFSQADASTALSALEVATIHDGTPASDRLVRCCAVASQGSLVNLASSIELLKIDWRDVIMQGEYRLKDGQPVRIRDLNNPIQS